MTHTFATLQVSAEAYHEIADKLKVAKYDHAFVDDAIDMHGIGLVRGGPLHEREPKERIEDLTRRLEIAQRALERVREYAKHPRGYGTRTAIIETVDDALAERTQAGAPTMADLIAQKDGAYEERNRLVSLLARLFPSGIAKTTIEGWSPEWENCVYIDLPTGQVSWHFHDREAYLFSGLPTYAGQWDGHDTVEKWRRVAAYAVFGPHPMWPMSVVPMLPLMAALAASISLLERTPGAKKAAPSDRMFDQMLDDYRKALNDARVFIASAPRSEPHIWRLACEVMREACAAEVERHDKAGREWVPGSFWDKVTREATSRIRALPIPAQREG